MLKKSEVESIKTEMEESCGGISSDCVMDLVETIEEMEKVIRGCDQELRDICKTIGQNYDSPCVTSSTKGFLIKYDKET
jgi:hypothetical protein